MAPALAPEVAKAGPPSGGTRRVRPLLPRSDGARYRRLTLEQAVDGAVVLTSHDMGGSDLAPWGADDEEITVTLAPRDARRLTSERLTFERLAALLAGHEDAVRRLIALCEARGVTPVVAHWT